MDGYSARFLCISVWVVHHIKLPPLDSRMDTPCGRGYWHGVSRGRGVYPSEGISNVSDVPDLASSTLARDLDDAILRLSELFIELNVWAIAYDSDQQGFASTCTQLRQRVAELRTSFELMKRVHVTPRFVRIRPDGLARSSAAITTTVNCTQQSKSVASINLS